MRTPRRSSRRSVGCLQNLKQQPMLYGEFNLCLSPCYQKKAFSIPLGFSSRLILTAFGIQGKEMLCCVLSTSIVFSVDSAESGILQWVECSEHNGGELTPGQGKTSSMNLPFLPYNQMSARKMSAGAGYLLIAVCVCLWPVDSWRPSVSLCVWSWGELRLLVCFITPHDTGWIPLAKT